MNSYRKRWQEKIERLDFSLCLSVQNICDDDAYFTSGLKGKGLQRSLQVYKEETSMCCIRPVWVVFVPLVYHSRKITTVFRFCLLALESDRKLEIAKLIKMSLKLWNINMLFQNCFSPYFAFICMNVCTKTLGTVDCLLMPFIYFQVNILTSRFFFHLNLNHLVTFKGNAKNWSGLAIKTTLSLRQKNQNIKALETPSLTASAVLYISNICTMTYFWLLCWDKIRPWKF